MATRGKVSRVFKLEAVKVVMERGVAATHVGDEVDAHESMLRMRVIELSEALDVSRGVF